MSYLKRLYLFVKNNNQSLKEKRLCFDKKAPAGATSTEAGTEPAAPAGAPEAAREEKRGKREKELRLARRERGPEPAASLAETPDILEGLDQKKFDELMGKKLEVDSDDIEKLIKFCNESEKPKENFAKILKKIEEKEINGSRLTQESLGMLLRYYKGNEKALNTIMSAMLDLNVALATGELIIAANTLDDKGETVKKIYKKIEGKKEQFGNFTSEVLLILINTVGLKELTNKIPVSKKIDLLGKEALKKEDRKTVFDELIKNNEQKKAISAIALAKNLKPYPELYKELLEKTPLYVRWAIVEDKNLDMGVRKDFYESLGNRKDEVLEPKVEEEKAPAEKTPLQEAGIEFTSTRVIFNIEGVRRSFKKSAAFENQLKKLKNPDAIKLACYEKLLAIIQRDGSIDKSDKKNYNKHRIASDADFERSNTALQSEISRLRAGKEAAVEVPGRQVATEEEARAGEEGAAPAVPGAPAPAVPGAPAPAVPGAPVPAAPGAPATAVPGGPAPAAPEAGPEAGPTARPPAAPPQPEARREFTAEEIKRRTEYAREYTETTLLPRIQNILPNKEIKLVEDKIEITMRKAPAEFPKFYVEPLLNREGKVTDIALSRKRYIVGDIRAKCVSVDLNNNILKEFLLYEEEEAAEEIRDHNNYAKFQPSDIVPRVKPVEGHFLEGEFKYKIPDIEKTFEVKDNKIMDLRSNDVKWNQNFDNLLGHQIYYSAFMDQFGMSSGQVPKAMQDIIGINRNVDFNDILRVTAKDDAVGQDTTRVEDFHDQFRDLLAEVRSPTVKTPEERAKNQRDLRQMYDLYIGGMKILQTLQEDRYKPPKRETFAQKYSRQIELAEPTNEKCMYDRYYDLERLGEGKRIPNKGKLQIGVSENAYNEFVEVYKNYVRLRENREITDAEIKENFPKPKGMGNILRAVFRAYSFDELVTMQKAVKVKSVEKGITKMLLVKLPDNFKADSLGVRVLLDYLKKGSLGEEKPWAERDMPTKEKDDLEKRRKIRRELSRNEETYRRRVLELLKAHRQIKLEKADPTEWAASAAVDLDTEMTLRNIAYYYDIEGLEIRRFTSPESMADNLFNKQNVEIRNEAGEKETIQLYSFENGVKIINEPNVKKYINHLFREGLKRRRRKEVHRERIFNYDDMKDSEVEIEENRALEAFLRGAGTPEAWEKVPGREPIEEILMKEPFNASKEEVPATVYKLLKGKEVITMESIVNTLLLERLREYTKPKSTDITKIDSFESLDTEFDYLGDQRINMRDELKSLEENIKEEGVPTKEQRQRKNELIKDLAEYDRRYNHLRVYVNASAILLQRLAKASTHISVEDAYASIALQREPHLLSTEMSVDQIDVWNEGTMAEKERGYAKQLIEQRGIEAKETPELSGSYIIREIQLKALKEGYPPSQIERIESKLLVAAGVGIKGNRIESGGVGFFVPIDEGFVVGFDINSKGAGLGMGVQLYKTEEREGGMAMRVGMEVMPEMFIGYSHAERIGDSTFFSVGIGTLFTATSAQVVAGIAFTHSDEKAVRNAEREITERAGFAKIEQAKSLDEKIALIKSHEAFKDYANQLADEDLLAIYESWKSLNTDTALQEADKSLIPYTPIVGIGLGIGYPPLTGFVGIMFKVGENIIIRPRIGERERLAEFVSQQRIHQELDVRLREVNPAVEFKTYGSHELYTTSRGETGVLENEQKPLEIQRATNLERLREELEKANMTAIRRDIVVKKGEPKKSVIELSVYDTMGKDVAIYVDDSSPDLEVAFTPDGKILIPGGLDNVIITRETFRYPYAKAPGGATATDVIVITTDSSFVRNGHTVNRHKIVSESKSVLERHWQGGEATAWDIEKGANPQGRPQIFRMEAYRGEKPREWKEEFKLRGTTRADWAEISDTADRMRKGPFEAITSREFKEQEPRKGWKETSEELFKKMEKGLVKRGVPAINDSPGIIREANRLLAQKGEPQIKNAKEAGQLLTLVQHRYFISIWRKKSRKGIERKFERHNESIIKKTLIPRFTDKITKLGIKPAAEAKTYARVLAERIRDDARKKFLSALDQIQSRLEGIKNPTDEQFDAAFKGLMTDIPKEMFFVSGSTIRKTDEGVLAGGARATEMPGITRMGILGAPKEWDINSSDQVEKDIARVLLETVSPRPSLGDIDSFHRSLAIKLASFEPTGVQIGKDNYRKLLEFYEKSRVEQEKILKTGKDIGYLNEFIKFANDVREAMLSGKGSLTLKNGDEMLFSVPKILSGAYGQCGNLSAMIHEGFFLVDKRRMLVAHTLTDVYADSAIIKEAMNVGIGVKIVGAVKKRRRGKYAEEGPAAQEPEDKQATEGAAYGEAPGGEGQTTTGEKGSILPV